MLSLAGFFVHRFSSFFFGLLDSILGRILGPDGFRNALFSGLFSDPPRKCRLESFFFQIGFPLERPSLQKSLFSHEKTNISQKLTFLFLNVFGGRFRTILVRFGNKNLIEICQKAVMKVRTFLAWIFERKKFNLGSKLAAFWRFWGTKKRTLSHSKGSVGAKMGF